jgi:hypothetical protein
MAQECMSIFERDKLPLVANVEQVPFLLFALLLFPSFITLFPRIVRLA